MPPRGNRVLIDRDNVTLCFREMRTTARFLGRSSLSSGTLSFEPTCTPDAVAGFPSGGACLALLVSREGGFEQSLEVTSAAEPACLSCQPSDNRAILHLTAWLTASCFAVLNASRVTTLLCRRNKTTAHEREVFCDACLSYCELQPEPRWKIFSLDIAANTHIRYCEADIHGVNEPKQHASWELREQVSLIYTAESTPRRFEKTMQTSKQQVASWGLRDMRYLRTLQSPHLKAPNKRVVQKETAMSAVLHLKVFEASRPCAETTPFRHPQRP